MYTNHHEEIADMELGRAARSDTPEIQTRLLLAPKFAPYWRSPKQSTGSLKLLGGCGW